METICISINGFFSFSNVLEFHSRGNGMKITKIYKNISNLIFVLFANIFMVFSTYREQFQVNFFFLVCALN